MKQDVPFLGTPVGYIVNSVVFLIAAVVIWANEPTTRPGIIDCTVGVVGGVPAGLLLGKAWVGFLQRLAQEVPARPWLKWTAHLVYPMVPLGPQTFFRLAVSLVMVAGMGGIYLALAALRSALTGVSPVWTRLNDLTVWQTTAATFIVYMLAWLASVTAVGLRWYRTLPD